MTNDQTVKQAECDFSNAVWSALKGDHNDLRRQALILRAYRTAHSGEGRSNGAGEDIKGLLGIDAAFLREHARTCEEEGCHKIASVFRAIAQRIAALSAPQGEVERLREARNTALEEAATVAIHNSNFGHVEGNKRAFKIADEIRGRKDAQPEAGGE